MSLDLYTVHSTPTEGEYIIQKFDTEYHCESVYALSLDTCMCPQGHKPSCRHRTMLQLFMKSGHVGDGWFIEWQTRMWRKPVNDMFAERPQELSVIDEASEIPAKAWDQIADDRVMGTSARAEEVSLPPPARGEDLSPEAAPPPVPSEGITMPQAAAATPASPTGAGVPFVKRRKVP